MLSGSVVGSVELVPQGLLGASSSLHPLWCLHDDDFWQLGPKSVCSFKWHYLWMNIFHLGFLSCHLLTFFCTFSVEGLSPYGLRVSTKGFTVPWRLSWCV